MEASKASSIKGAGPFGALLALVAVVVLALPAVAGARVDQGGASKLTQVKLLIDFFPGAINGPTFAAIGEGYFADQGLEVSVEFSPTAASTQNLVAGKGDIAYAPSANFLSYRQRSGVPLKSLYAYQQTSPMAIISLQKSGITKLTDLRGKTIVDFAGSATQIAWPVLLRRNKIDPSSITMQLTDPASRIKSLLAGQVDAMLAFWPDNGPLVESVCNCAVNVIKFDDYGVHHLGNGFATTPDYIKQNPALLRRFFKAVTKGALFAQRNQAKTVDDMIQVVGATAAGDRNVGIATLKNLITQYQSPTSKRLKLPMGAYALADWKATIGLLVSGGAAQAERNVSDVYSNEFVPCYTTSGTNVKFVACPKKPTKKK
jgi:NitT/TauT family transport system substrate-binding protein